MFAIYVLVTRLSLGGPRDPDTSLHISRRRLRMPGVCETNQLDRKTFGDCLAVTACTYSLSGKM
jgi:hypothetical protein